MRKHLISWVLLVSTVLFAMPITFAAEAFPLSDSGEYRNIALIHNSSISEEEWEVLRLTNQHRMSVGLQPLSTYDAMQKVGNQRATELTIQYHADHSRPDGREYVTAFSDYGVSYRTAAENIAVGQYTASEVMRSWLNSSSHRKNIEDSSLTHLGVGFASDYNGKYYWAQDFMGASCSYSSISLSHSQISNASSGESLENILAKANIVVTAVCSKHGVCKLPLIASMCSSYNANTSKTQKITVKMGGSASTTFTISQQKAETYTITFDPNGGTLASNYQTKTVTNGSTYGSLPAPTMSGYIFDGWYTSYYGNTEITSNTTVNIIGDQTLYAHWTREQPRTYTVMFNPNGGTLRSNYQTKTVTNGSIYGSLPVPTMDGYIFDGWYTSYYGDTEITPNTTVNITSDQILYAHWTKERPKTYTVTFDPNGGTLSSNYRTKTVTSGSVYGPLPVPTMDGYIFDGWYTSYYGNTEITSSATVNVTSDQTLYAHWTKEQPKTYIITFHPNGGILNSDYQTKTVTNGSTYGSLPVPTMDGYIFDGWYTSYYRDTEIIPGTTVNLTGNQTLYAHWTKEQPKTHTVTFYPNGGVLDSGYQAKTVTNGSTYGSLPIPMRSGYTFDGWYTSYYGNTKITSITPVNLTDDQTLYAHWNRKEGLSSSETSVGEVAGTYYSTDIVTYVNGKEISSINIGGQTLISAEDMAYYGFDVTWWEELRWLEIVENPYARNRIPPAVERANLPPGTPLGYYYITDIVTSLNGQIITAYNIGGRTYLWAEEMRDFGYQVDWNAWARILSVSRI